MHEGDASSSLNMCPPAEQAGIAAGGGEPAVGGRPAPGGRQRVLHPSARHPGAGFSPDTQVSLDLSGVHCHGDQPGSMGTHLLCRLTLTAQQLATTYIGKTRN